MFHKKRQIYRLNSLKACERWIEVINSAIIYGKFWTSLLLKYPELIDYFYKTKILIEKIEDNIPWEIKEEKIEKVKEKVKCECGYEVCKYVLARHKQTKKHINLMSQLIRSSINTLISLGEVETRVI